MESLFRLFARYRVFLLFLLLEGFAISLIYNSSYYQQSSMMAWIDAAKGNIYSVTSKWTSYFGLKDENLRLARENTDLRNQLDHFLYTDSVRNITVSDTAGKQQYTYIMGEVVSNSTNLKNNFIIINLGSKQGLHPEMPVISDDGVVGMVSRVSGNYSTIRSLLNTEWKISAMLKRTGHFGPLKWDGKNIDEAILIEVPQHAAVEVGDTIVTSGFSAEFPKGVMIGTVKSFEVKKGNFYEIKVHLNVDFKKLRYVNVVNMLYRDELKELMEKPSQQ